MSVILWHACILLLGSLWGSILPGNQDRLQDVVEEIVGKVVTSGPSGQENIPLQPPGSLTNARQIMVQVVRQEPTTLAADGTVLRRGTASIVQLTVGKNDIGNALAQTGGIRGTDDEVRIMRRNNDESQPPTILRFPLHRRDQDPIPFKISDVTLQNGDVVFTVASEQLSIADVLQMSRDGVAPKAIIERLEASKAIFRLAAADVASLRKQGVNMRVIRAMKESASRSPAVGDTPPADSSVRNRLFQFSTPALPPALAPVQGTPVSAVVPSLPAPMTIDEIVTLSKAGAPADIIIRQMEATGSNFVLTTNDLVNLLEKGVSHEVIACMQMRRASSSVAPASQYQVIPTEAPVR